MAKLISENEKRDRRAKAVREQRIQTLMKRRKVPHAEAAQVVDVFEKAKAAASLCFAARAFGVSNEKAISETEAEIVRSILGNPIVCRLLEEDRKKDAKLDYILSLISQLYT